MNFRILREVLTELSLGVTSFEECLDRILKRTGTAFSEYDESILEKQLGKKVELESIVPTAEALHILPLEIVHSKCILPYAIVENQLFVACLDTTDFTLLVELQLLSGLEINLNRANLYELKEALRKHYRNSTLGLDKSSIVPEVKKLSANGNESSPAVKLIEDALREAYRNKASDIHLEPSSQGLVVRIRQDGDLRVYRVVPSRFKDEAISRVKIMAQLDIAEKRRPQDGRTQWMSPGGRVDIRVSTLPTNHGEKIVLRLLDQSSVPLELGSLGMTEFQIELFERYIRNPHGMILFTGPTGSGKTTSLYATLSTIRRPELNISTVEDPIEYRLDGINQTQVQSKIGLTFAHVLRTLLRQDPNVLLIGEIRDGETADMAVRAALTGHLVFSTLHTNDAPGALARLIDLGVESFLVSSSVSLVVAQRLVRRCCQICIEWKPVPYHLANEFGIDTTEHLPHPKGCRQCDGSGFEGRIAIYEMMEMSSGLRDQLRLSADSELLRKQALVEGMISLRMDGLEKARLGLTTLEEVAKEVL